MADGGACSSDPFRLPGPEEELTHPFGNGLVVRYGCSSRLVACALSVVAVANFPPQVQVRTDSIALVWAILKCYVEGLHTVLGAKDKFPHALFIFVSAQQMVSLPQQRGAFFAVRAGLRRVF